MCACKLKKKGNSKKVARKGRPKPFKDSKITLGEVRRAVNADKRTTI